MCAVVVAVAAATAYKSDCGCAFCSKHLQFRFVAFFSLSQWCNNDLNWVMNLNVKVKKPRLNEKMKWKNFVYGKFVLFDFFCSSTLFVFQRNQSLIWTITCAVPEPILFSQFFYTQKRDTWAFITNHETHQTITNLSSCFLFGIQSLFFSASLGVLSPLKIWINNNNNKWIFLKIHFILNDDHIKNWEDQCCCVSNGAHVLNLIKKGTRNKINTIPQFANVKQLRRIPLF